MRPDTAAKPSMNSVLTCSPISGAGFTSLAVDIDDVGDAVDHQAEIAAADADSTDNTMMTVSGVYSARSQAEAHAQVDDRHDRAAQIEHAEHVRRRLRNARHRRPAADFLHAQDVHAVRFVAEREGQHLIANRPRRLRPSARQLDCVIRISDRSACYRATGYWLPARIRCACH